jgi:hypothetical protein
MSDNGLDVPIRAICTGVPGVQDELVTTEPDRFFRPPHVGGRGWLGLRLDGEIDWGEIVLVCEEAFRTVAPKKLVAALDLGRIEDAKAT